jgi:hypothetical protein
MISKTISAGAFSSLWEYYTSLASTTTQASSYQRCFYAMAFSAAMATVMAMVMAMVILVRQ